MVFGSHVIFILNIWRDFLVAMEMIVPDNVEELKRNKLQSLCKTFKIPANLKVSIFYCNMTILMLNDVPVTFK